MLRSQPHPQTSEVVQNIKLVVVKRFSHWISDFAVNFVQLLYAYAMEKIMDTFALTK